MTTLALAQITIIYKIVRCKDQTKNKELAEEEGNCTDYE
jgi:hypothetical protein